jgi:hypothetical protein
MEDRNLGQGWLDVLFEVVCCMNYKTRMRSHTGARAALLWGGDPALREGLWVKMHYTTGISMHEKRRQNKRGDFLMSSDAFELGTSR